MPSFNYPYAPQYYPQPNYQMQSMQPLQQTAPQPSVSQQTQQIQNGGFVSVRSEEEARNYPVAIGNSVTFKDENSPYVYTKTMGFSQLDRPIFEKYKLMKEDAGQSMAGAAELSDLEKVKSDIREIWGKLDEIEDARRKNQSQQKNDRNGER